MSDNVHCVIASVPSPGRGDAAAHPPTHAAAPAASLPNLQLLLAQLTATERHVMAEGSPAMPWEMRMAHLTGLPGRAGHVPWAAHESGVLGTPCAWMTLCHWEVGTDYVLLASPGSLAVDEDTSVALHAAMSPYFTEEDFFRLASCRLILSLACLH